MSEHKPILEGRRFGEYLRSVREERKLSLDAVEEMSLGYPGRITKSHLSRIENGHAEPTLPRMFALSRIYGVPLATLAERMERELSRALTPIGIDARTDDSLREEADEMRTQGRYEEALRFYDTLIDRAGGHQAATSLTSSFIDLLLARVTCLTQLWRMAIAREEVESLLGEDGLDPRQRATAMFLFTMCCFCTSRFTIAQMAVEPTEQLIAKLPENSKLRAKFAVLKGNLAMAMGRSHEACAAFRDALRELRRFGDKLEACRTRINFATALMEIGKSRESRRHLLIALRTAERRCYDRLRAFALSTLGVLAYREKDFKTAEAYCLKSNSISRIGEFASLIFRNSYYLWKMAAARGDASAVRSYERTLKKYVTRVQDYLAEVIDYKQHLTGSD